MRGGLEGINDPSNSVIQDLSLSNRKISNDVGETSFWIAGFEAALALIRDLQSNVPIS